MFIDGSPPLPKGTASARAMRAALHVTGACAVSFWIAGCGASASPEGIGATSQASVTTPQTPLDGNTLPKFVEPLPTFNGRRVNGPRPSR